MNQWERLKNMNKKKYLMVNDYRLDKVLKRIKEIIGTGKLMILKY